MVGFRKMFIFQLFFFLLHLWYTQTVSAIDLTTNNATGAGDMTIARYMVNQGFSGGQSVNNATQESGLYDYARSHGNQSPWYVINDGSATSIAVTYWDCGQWGSTCTPTPDYFGYKFKYPAEVNKITFTDYSFSDGGTFSSTPALQYQPSPGGSWTTVSAAWNIPYVSSFAGGRSNTYIITPDIPIKGAWGLRLHGNAAPAPGAMDQSGWVSVREFKVEGQPYFGRSINFANNLIAGATPVCSNSAWQSGSGNEMLDGNFDNNTQVWDLNQPSGNKYVGVTWDSPKNNVTALGFGMTFNSTGGWFVDTQENPLRVQYTLDGSNWIDVSGLNKGRYTDDYSAAAALGYTYKGSWLFSFNPVSGIRGLRLLALPGGNGLNGFGYVSIREFQVFSSCLEPPSGLVSWWGGDNNALDMVGGNHGNLNGATFATGQVGQAFSFDGVDDYVAMVGGITSAAQFSFSFWMNITSFTHPWYPAPICQSQTQPGLLPGFCFASGNDYRDFGMFGVWSDGTLFDLRVPIPFGTGVWKHVSVTYDGSSMRQYVDGELLNEDFFSGKTLGNDQPFVIGQGKGYPGGNLETGYFHGLVDEVAFFNRPLSAEEVAAIYNAGSAGKCRSCAPPPSGMVAWWRAEEDADDFFGANNGVLQDNTGFVSGKVGQAFRFDGEWDHVEVWPGGVASFGANPFTVDFWMYALTNGVRAQLVGKSAPDSEAGWAIQYNENRIRVWGVSGWDMNIESDASIISNTWHHVALSSTADNAYLYIDGVLKGTSSRGTISNASNPFNIGWIFAYNNGGWGGFNGLIDEVEIFNRALSQDEIAAIYNAGSAGKCLPAYTLSVSKAGNGAGTITSDPVGINCGAICAADYVHGTQVVLTASADTGSTFTGWSGEGCSGTGTCTVAMDQAWSVTATFTLNTYSLTVTPSETGSGTVTGNGIDCAWNRTSSSGTCSVNLDYNTAVTLTAVPNTGSTFSGWSGGTGSAAGCSGTGACSFSLTEASGVGAPFPLNTYTVTANAQGNGTGAVSSSAGGVNYNYPAVNTGTTSALGYGTNLVLTATASAQSTAAWTTCTGTAVGNGTTEATCTYSSLEGNETAEAVFTVNTFTLTVTPSGTGSGSVTGDGIDCAWNGNGSSGICSVTLAFDTAVSLRADPLPGSTFNGWNGGTGSAAGCSGTGTCAFNITLDSGVEAPFTRNNSIYLPLIIRP